jgi:hypothetical protein
MKIITHILKKPASVALVVCFLLISSAHASQERQCSSNIVQLGKDLQVMLAKIPIMPPIGEVYRPLKQLFDQARAAQRQENYTECLQKTELALQHSKAYR